MQTTCIFCGTNVVLVHVHGHYQCPLCKTNALPCCDGDNCSNFLLAGEEYPQSNENDLETETIMNANTKGSNG
ncbi:MAG TPA: hypothetical protein PKC54_01570 [Ferruginibacter sp.]|nr:hypothetical protein [Ferruginibacter sp.]